MRLRLESLKLNLKSLEKAKERYGRIRRFVTGININIRLRKSQIARYERRIQRYLEEGRIL